MAESRNQVGELKAALRGQARQRRARLDHGIRQARGKAIADRAWELLAELRPSAGPVACTWSMQTEPPTDPLIDRLREEGYEVVTPRIVQDRVLTWVPTPVGAELVQGPLGIRTPIGAGEVALGTCSAIVVPALALDRRGTRLGQGGGYFDRALGALPRHDAGGPLRIGVIYADELADHLPREEHDEGVDLIVTESDIIAVESR